MSKRRVIKKLLRLKILWAGFFIAAIAVVVWYAPKLSEPVPDEPVKIGFIGDSITHGVKNMHSPVESEIAVLGADFVAVNEARSGTASKNWLPGYQLFDNALASFKAQNVHVVSIMLGTNDARTDIATNPAVYEKNLSAMIASLLTSGSVTRVIINYPPYVTPGAIGLWDDTSISRLKLYMGVIDILAREKGVVKGDSKAFSYFQQHQELLLDGVHPNAEGNVQLGRLWANAYEKIMSEQLANRFSLPVAYKST